MARQFLQILTSFKECLRVVYALHRLFVYELLIDNIKPKIDGSVSSCFCYVDRAFPLRNIKWLKSTGGKVHAIHKHPPSIWDGCKDPRMLNIFMLFQKSKHKQFTFKKVKGIFILNWLVDFWLEESKEIKINHKEQFVIVQLGIVSVVWLETIKCGIILRTSNFLLTNQNHLFLLTTYTRIDLV